MTKDEIVKQIMAEFEKDGEPITLADAEEMAEMEIKAKGIGRYEKAESGQKKTNKKPKKEDMDKRLIVEILYDILNEKFNDTTVTNPEKYIDFSYKGKQYTVNLVCHRK